MQNQQHCKKINLIKNEGTITRWTQERSDLDTLSWHYGYDAATRLTSAILKDPTHAILQIGMGHCERVDSRGQRRAHG
jgi:hypothetical protein